MTPKVKLRRAYDTIYDRFPFFSSIVMSWKVVFTSDLKYAATNGPTLFINPSFIEQLNVAATTDLIEHEAGHVFFGHMFRHNQFKSHREQNIAFDAAINDNLDPYYDKDPKNIISQIFLFPGKRHSIAGDQFLTWPKGRDAEFYLTLLEKSRPKDQPKGQPSEEEDGEESEGEGEGKPSDKSGKGSGKGKGKSGNAKIPTSGGEQAGEQETLPQMPNNLPGDKRTDLPESVGDVLPHPVMEDGDEEAIEEAIEEWKQQVAQGINAARQAGTLPGFIETIANAMYGQKSKQDWRSLLRRWLVQVVAGGGTTYSRPNRRHAWRSTAPDPLIIAAKRSRQPSKGLIFVDTSGSMSDDACNQALAEIEAIVITHPRCELDMVMADVRLIKDSKKHFGRYDFPLKVPAGWMGRGGTVLSGAILEAARDGDYKWMVVISDMEWAVNEAANPKLPVIWIWTQDAGETATEPHQRPTFGTFIGPIVAAA